MQWETVIGLEVHTQLSTKSKIFSGASTTYGAEPNTQADAVSIALPGVLPVLNKGAVERAIKFGLAVGAHIAPRSVFARKNYFYPDLPKGYQISQFDLPVVGQGALTIQVEPLSGPSTGSGQTYEKVVRITRAHLEEDAGKSVHGVQGSGGYSVADGYGVAGSYGRGNVTGIDLNRAGTPLLEIVSEPDMSSAAEAVAYAKTLHSLVRWIGICDGNMQEGSFRCDVNVSVRRPGEPLGTRREIKNLNSFKFMQQAIDYEVQWQIDTLENGGKIHQATVLFDADKGTTHAMRSKEEAHDYRYFPDPDLLPLDITPTMLEQVRATLPELPQAKKLRYVNDLGLSSYDANILISSKDIADYFELVLDNSLDTKLTSNRSVDKKLAANWVIGELSVYISMKPGEPTMVAVTPNQLALLLIRIQDETISSKIAKDIFKEMCTAKNPSFDQGLLNSISRDDLVDVIVEMQSDNWVDAIIKAKGLKQVSDTGAIEKIVDEIIAANPAQVAEYRGGKEKVFGFFVGLAMKASKGKANPAQLNDVLKKKLAG